MSNNDGNNLLEHENDEINDGIREYDNMLPKWWVNIFYITIIFSAFYIYYYHLGGGGKSQTEIFDQELAQQNLIDSVNKKSEIKFTPDMMAAYIKEPQKLAQGKAIYEAKCVACHRTDGGGNIGPNLTDAFWLHGGKPEQIAHTIYYGVVEKGMVAWGQLLSEEEVNLVTGYVVSLKGTNPANPKAPQGEKETP